MDKVRVTLLGGGYIGRIHIAGYRNLPVCYPDAEQYAELTNLVTRNPNGAVASLFEHADRDTEKIQATDIVDICTPNFLHEAEIRELAGKGFRCIYCEKPVTGFYSSEEAMAQFAAQHGILDQTALVYRFLPALIRARRIVREGMIGNILHFKCSLYHGSYLNPKRPMSWRLRRETSGGGALVDLGIHVIDSLTFLLGNIASAEGYTKTFIKTRPDGSDRGEVDVDDFAFLKVAAAGANGTIEVSRITAGADGNLDIAVYGTEGAVHVNSGSPDYPEVFFTSRGAWECGASCVFPDTEADIADLWPSGKYTQGTMENMHMASIRCLMNRMEGREPRGFQPPRFSDSAKAMKIIDAVYRDGRFQA